MVERKRTPPTPNLPLPQILLRHFQTSVHLVDLATCHLLRPQSAVLTVWKKSLLLRFSGFTVLDGSGNLVYCFDSYAADNKAEILLMDADGKRILTMRRKRLSLGETWMVYDGEKMSNPFMDGARIYTENAICKPSEQMNYLRLSSRLDAVASRLYTQAKMQTIGKSMSTIVRVDD